MNSYALIIPTYENNIGFKLSALDTYLKHVPKNMDIFFVYGGNIETVIKSKKGDVEYTDLYFKVPEKITALHKKLFYAFRKLNKQKYTHFIKVDDDTFIHNIDTFLNHKISGDYVGNKVLLETEVQRISARNKLIHLKNYKIRDSYLGELPNQYCSGECIMFSKKAIDTIVNYRGPEKFEKFALEDVTMGKILEKSNIKINLNKFINYEHPVDLNKFHSFYEKHYIDEPVPA